MSRSRILIAAVSGTVLLSGLVALHAGPASAAPTAKPTCTITGTAGDDVLRGTPGDDVICGLGGDDVIRGRGGDDVLIGGRGDDVLFGGRGDDVFDGNSDEAKDTDSDEPVLRLDGPQLTLRTMTNLPEGTNLRWVGRAGGCVRDAQDWRDVVQPGWDQEHDSYVLGNLVLCRPPVPYRYRGEITLPNGTETVVSVGADVGEILLPPHGYVVRRHQNPQCLVVSGNAVTCTATIVESKPNQLLINLMAS